jgi:hypothetical protein
MERIATKTRLTPEEVIKRAVTFFGPAGLNLKVTEQSPNCAHIEGGGGSIEISACAEGGKTSVEFVSREWDSEVEEFIEKIAR